MKFSNRIKNIQVSPIRKLIPYADKVKETGVKVIHLNIGQPDIETPKEFLEAVDSYNTSVLEYAPSRGLKKTLETTQLYLHNYGLDFDLDEIIITNGASEGLTFATSILCDKGDEIITVEPYYPNYNSFAGMAEAKLVGLKSSIENNFAMPSYEEFKAAITDKTRAILISSPGNPTGRVYTKEEIETIVQIAKDFDLFILADEVYREFNYTERDFISFADYKEIEDRVILFDSISKKYSACGARIGSIASKNKEFMDHAMKLAQARLSISTLDQIGAGAMDIVDDEYVYKNRRIYKKRRAVLDEYLSKIEGLEYATPEGAFYTIVRLPVDDAEEFIKYTLENVRIDGHTVMLTPAESFYTEEGVGNNEARISYCVAEEKIKLACEIIDKSLKEYNKK